MKRTGSFFPQGHPKAGGLLKHFFRDRQEPRGGYLDGKHKGTSDLKKKMKAKSRRETLAKAVSASSDQKELEGRPTRKLRAVAEALEFGPG